MPSSQQIVVEEPGYELAASECPQSGSKQMQAAESEFWVVPYACLVGLMQTTE